VSRPVLRIKFFATCRSKLNRRKIDFVFGGAKTPYEYKLS